jgi:hypothetical protein
MSESIINKDKKSETTTDNIDFGSINSIIAAILGAFSIPDKPVTKLPPQTLVIGGNL